jgi:penicillin-binding protein 2
MKTTVEVRAHGQNAVSVGQQEPIPGKTLSLTIDKRLETIAENVMHSHGWTGAVAAIDPQTGAVLALASAPTYNLNWFATGIDSNQWRQLRDNDAKPLVNRAVDSLYPPGSTFKQIVAAAGLETGAISTSTSVYCTGEFDLNEHSKFKCWTVHGETDFYKAIAQSCDVFFYKAGLKIGPDALAKYGRDYGIGRETGIDLPHEMAGVMPDPTWKEHRFRHWRSYDRQWHDGDTVNTSIGQGYVLTTPLQMAVATAATANGGKLYKPYLVHSISDPATQTVITRTTPQVVSTLPISDNALASVRRGMRQCVTNGTGAAVNFNGVEVAAKTGSAQATGTKKTHGWFVAFAPYDHPVIAVAAIVERGGHGGESAGKIVAAILRAYFNLSANDNGKSAPTD